jgi:hypothetical protein
MKNITRFTTSKTLRTAIAAVLLTGLTSVMRTQADSTANGSLQVFSATHEVQWGEGATYYPHTGYRLVSASHETKWVDNENSVTDSKPEQVELAPGTYTIWAQSEKGGFVQMPVTIKASQATEVHL